MKTKQLLLTAAIAVVGTAASMAQTVYSVNVVGYVNLTLKPGFNLISNPLNTTNNTIGSLVGNLPPGTQLFKYRAGTGWDVYTMDEFDLVWTGGPPGTVAPNVTLNPGEGAFISNPGATDLTVTFVGEVLQATTAPLTLPLHAGFNVVSSMVPTAGTPDQLQIPAIPGDQIFQYRGVTGYDVSTFDEFDLVWTPVPNIKVGESFWISKRFDASWTRNFVVQ